MTDGYGLDAAALRATADGINEAIGELKELGWAEEASAGRGFSELALSGLEVGHPGVQEALDRFCERWEWGVRTLVQDGNEIAGRLGLAAGRYHEIEQYAVGLLKNLAVDVAGDPRASNEEVDKKSWAELTADVRPDYSEQSWDKAGDQMAAQWKATGRDFSEGPLGLGKAAAELAGAGEEFKRLQDDTFGPAPRQDGS
jgi:hypothetical protein